MSNYTMVRDGRPRFYFQEPPFKEIDEGRGSGRTYQMLQRALATALQGQTVYVLAADRQHCKILMSELQTFEKFKQLFNVHVSMPAGDIQLPSGQLRFRTPEDNWRWDTGQFQGMPPGVPTFIDHHTWETELKKEPK